METPLCGRSGGHAGTAPTISFGQITRGRVVSFGGLRVEWLISFGQIACGRLVSFGWIARGRLISFGWIACRRLISFGWIKHGRLALSLRYSARMPLRILFFYAFYFCSVYFFNG